jgi:ribosome modulation factor
MNIPAADDMTTIRSKMEYERGFQDGVQGKVRASPEGCPDRPAWLEGYDLGAKMKPKEE